MDGLYRYNKRMYSQRGKDKTVTVITRKAPEQHSKRVPYTTTDEDEYKMDNSGRGRVFIINNHFTGRGNLVREGTDADEENLKENFTKRLGFEENDITVVRDCTCEKILKVIDEASRADYTAYDCVIVVVMTHGKEDLLMGEDVDDFCFVTIDDISEPFQFSASLLGKPKIFIFQACRGERAMKFYEITLQTDASSEMPAMDRNRVPAYPDFLYIFSTPVTYYAYRDFRDGAWFIQEFCNVIRKDGVETKEIMEILAEANNELSKKRNTKYTKYIQVNTIYWIRGSNTNFNSVGSEPISVRTDDRHCLIESNLLLQVASFESTLLKELYFKTKHSVNTPRS